MSQAPYCLSPVWQLTSKNISLFYLPLVIVDFCRTPFYLICLCSTSNTFFFSNLFRFLDRTLKSHFPSQLHTCRLLSRYRTDFSFPVQLVFPWVLQNRGSFYFILNLNYYICERHVNDVGIFMTYLFIK